MIKAIPKGYEIKGYENLQNKLYFQTNSVYSYKQCNNCNYKVIDYGKPYSVLLRPSLDLRKRNAIVFMICTQPSETQLRMKFRKIISTKYSMYKIDYFFTLTRDNTITNGYYLLEKEQSVYHDLLVFNHTNSYANLALTVLLSFHYLNSQNLDFRYLVKTDADCAVNIPLLYGILQHPSITSKEHLYIGDCFRSTFSNPKKKHYVPREIISDNPVVKSVARGGLYVLSSKIIPYLLIGVRHLSFLTHQEDLTVGRSLNKMRFSCMNVYSKWISRFGCAMNCSEYVIIHPKSSWNEIDSFYNLF